ncbi:MAG: phosphatase PAP2 family protein [Flavobacteriales bacterium]|jgi:undecaprenyl-diphosphatase|nr:phosphatase PAP2 family protein [Flavobacteriales bacterium]
MTWTDAILAADRTAFLAVNGAHNATADGWMTWLSDLRLWFPVYVLFLVLIKMRWGWRGLWLSLPVAALMILCSDTGSVVLFKDVFLRLRPCHAPDLVGLVHLVDNHCGGQYGFISSHASNHFALAAFMAGMLQRRPWWVLPLLLLWAGLIAYSRVYLGVHYPGDVIVGALYGSLIGGLAYWLFRWVHQRTIEK